MSRRDAVALAAFAAASVLYVMLLVGELAL